MDRAEGEWGSPVQWLGLRIDVALAFETLRLINCRQAGLEVLCAVEGCGGEILSQLM
jgi:hypothetical protein